MLSIDLGKVGCHDLQRLHFPAKKSTAKAVSGNSASPY